MGGSSSEGHTNADFPRLKRNKIGHHAVNTNQSEKETEGSEDAEEKCLRTRRSVDFSNPLVECCDSSDGLISVDGPDAVLKRGNKGKGVGTGADNYIDTEDAIGLEKGSVDLGLRGLLGIGMIGFANVSGDADDFTPDGMTGGEVGGETLAGDINRAEVFSRERFVNDEDGRLLFRVVHGEIAAGEERDSEGAEVIGRDPIGEGGLLSVLGIGGGLGGERSFGNFIGQGKDQTSRSGGNARSGARGVEDLLNVSDGSFGSGETKLGKVEAKREDMGRTKTEI